jgi:LPS export ABC transporter protein LptC
MNNQYKKIISIILCLSLIGCQGGKKEEEIQSNSPPREIETGLVLHNATLEQSNENGQPLWKLSTEKAVYSQDKKNATLENITGNLFSNGQLVLQLKAKKGEIKQDGEQVYLKEEIIAVDPRNKAELKASELEWKTGENIVILRNGIKGNHAQLTVSAKEGIYHTQEQRLELGGEIIAVTKNPQLQLKTEHLYWEIPQSKVKGDRPLKMIRFQDKIVTDQVTTDQAEVDLKTNTATIRGNNEYKSLEPPLSIASNEIIWQYKNRLVMSNNPIKIIQTGDYMELTANQATVDLGNKMAILDKGIYGEASQKEVKIYGDQGAWNIATDQVEITGNVYYQQINPDFNFSGANAYGSLQDKSIVVTGDNQTKVVTEIYPKNE